jgi:hypothetical protein
MADDDNAALIIRPLPLGRQQEISFLRSVHLTRVDPVPSSLRRAYKKRCFCYLSSLPSPSSVAETAAKTVKELFASLLIAHEDISNEVSAKGRSQKRVDRNEVNYTKVSRCC